MCLEVWKTTFTLLAKEEAIGQDHNFEQLIDEREYGLLCCQYRSSTQQKVVIGSVSGS